MEEKKNANPQPKTVDEYLAALPEPVRINLAALRQAIKNAVPEAEETISYQMPGYKWHGMLAWFAAFKNHYSLFVKPAVLNAFKDRLSAYGTTKSALHFPNDTPAPVQLVMEILRHAAAVNVEKTERKQKR